MQDEHVVQEKFTTRAKRLPAARAPRGLRVVGLCALVVAIAVVVFGIVERRQNEVTVAQWTEALISKSRYSRQVEPGGRPGSAGQHPGVVRG